MSDYEDQVETFEKAFALVCPIHAGVCTLDHRKKGKKMLTIVRKGWKLVKIDG